MSDLSKPQRRCLFHLFWFGVLGYQMYEFRAHGRQTEEALVKRGLLADVLENGTWKRRVTPKGALLLAEIPDFHLEWELVVHLSAKEKRLSIPLDMLRSFARTARFMGLECRLPNRFASSRWALRGAFSIEHPYSITNPYEDP